MKTIDRRLRKLEAVTAERRARGTSTAERLQGAGSPILYCYRQGTTRVFEQAPATGRWQAPHDCRASATAVPSDQARLMGAYNAYYLAFPATRPFRRVTCSNVANRRSNAAPAGTGSGVERKGGGLAASAPWWRPSASVRLRFKRLAAVKSPAKSELPGLASYLLLMSARRFPAMRIMHRVAVEFPSTLCRMLATRGHAAVVSVAVVKMMIDVSVEMFAVRGTTDPRQ